MLSGPTDIPSSPTHALVCLHGFGADGQDFIGLATPLRGLLPHVQLALFCPNGPDSTPFGQGRQWFSDKSWTFRDRAGIQAASDALWGYIQAELVSKHGIPLAHIALMGFSQGGMTALFAAPRWPERIGAVIAHSGLAMWQDELDAATCQKPPTLILHGQDDDVVPADQALLAAGGLAQLGVPVESHIIPNLAHGVNGESLARIGVFLESLWPAA